MCRWPNLVDRNFVTVFEKSYATQRKQEGSGALQLLQHLMPSGLRWPEMNIFIQGIVSKKLFILCAWFHDCAQLC